MNDQARAELRELQARAYGRGGDIHDDPDALRRLEELQAEFARVEVAEVERPETRADVDPETGPGSWADGDVEADAGIGAEAEGTDRGGPADAEHEVAGDPAEAEDEPAPTSRWRRWMPWLWIGSVLVVAGLVATWNLTSAAFTLIAGDSGIRQVDVIPVDESFEGWTVIGPAEAQTGFNDFYGMKPVAMTGDWYGGDSDDLCLALVRTDDLESESESINGPFYTSCGAGPFRATVQFTVSMDFPPEFQDRFPPGKAMQFVLDGDRVTVFTEAD